jgi:hypothetical protein
MIIRNQRHATGKTVGAPLAGSACVPPAPGKYCSSARLWVLPPLHPGQRLKSRLPHPRPQIRKYYNEIPDAFTRTAHHCRLDTPWYLHLYCTGQEPVHHLFTGCNLMAASPVRCSRPALYHARNVHECSPLLHRADQLRTFRMAENRLNAEASRQRRPASSRRWPSWEIWLRLPRLATRSPRICPAPGMFWWRFTRPPDLLDAALFSPQWDRWWWLPWSRSQRRRDGGIHIATSFPVRCYGKGGYPLSSNLTIRMGSSGLAPEPSGPGADFLNGTGERSAGRLRRTRCGAAVLTFP